MNKLPDGTRVLIVEDEDVVTRGLIQTLQRGYGVRSYQILSAESLRDTRFILSSIGADINLVFLDFELTDGLSTELAHENAFHERTKVILMSGYLTTQGVLSAFKARWTAVELRKPFDHERLDGAFMELGLIQTKEVMGK